MLFKLIVPWIFATLGVRKWLTERAIHVPDVLLDGVAAIAVTKLPSDIDPRAATPQQWVRAVEQAQAALLYGAFVQAAGGIPDDKTWQAVKQAKA